MSPDLDTIAYRLVTLEITCQGFPQKRVDLLIRDPARPIVGTVLLGTGSDGNRFYECLGATRRLWGGANVVRRLLDRGFRVVQRAWDVSWARECQQPPACAEQFYEPISMVPPAQIPQASVLLQSCRYAELLRYVHANELEPGTAFCAVAESAGSSEIAYALTQWGAASMLDLAVLASGPPHTRIDYSCSGNWPGGDCFPPKKVLEEPTDCRVGLTEYRQVICNSCPCEHHEASILFPGASTYYPTRIHVLIGTEDPEFAPPAYAFYSSISSESVIQFVPDAIHNMQATAEGRDAIVAAVLSGVSPSAVAPATRIPATLSVHDWVSIGETLTFEVQGSFTGQSSGGWVIGGETIAEGAYVFASVVSGGTTPAFTGAEIESPNVGYYLLSANDVASVVARVNPSSLQQTVHLQVKVPFDQDMVDWVFRFQALVVARGAARLTNMVEVKIRESMYSV